MVDRQANASFVLDSKSKDPSHFRALVRTSMTCITAAAVFLLSHSTIAANENQPSDADATSDAQASAQRIDQLIEDALAAEIYGDVATRTECLNQVLDLDPDNSVARWHLGYVRHQGEWVAAEDLTQMYQSNGKIRRYLSQRNDGQDTIDGNLALAAWCQENELYDQERAHLCRVLQFNPNHEYARLRLGFRQIDGRWIAAADIQNSMMEAIQASESFQAWRDDITELHQQLYAERPVVRQLAHDQLMEIDDASAIPAIENLMTVDTPEVAMVAIDVMAQIHQPVAARALARQAVFSPWEDVRQYAANQLAERDRAEYVPDLLSELQCPVMAIDQIIPGRGRRLVHRKVYFTETQDSRRAHVQDAEFRRVLPIGDADETWNRVLRQSSMESLAENVSVQQMNMRNAQLNERICETLRTATGVDLPSQPQAWWDWWNQDNDILIEGSKALFTSYDRREQQVLDSAYSTPDPATQSTGAVTQQTPQARSYECLVEGTQIWTAAGPLAIDQIQIGDLVLAKDVETGEFTYKPVVRTTRRPSGPIIQIELFDEIIQSSPGHPFWVSGEGWVKAKDLQSGMELHTMKGAVRISGVTDAPERETFNLVVDGFGSYFVGQHRVLSHDHTMPSATSRAVPGLE